MSAWHCHQHTDSLTCEWSDWNSDKQPSQPINNAGFILCLRFVDWLSLTTLCVGRPIHSHWEACQTKAGGPVTPGGPLQIRPKWGSSFTHKNKACRHIKVQPSTKTVTSPQAQTKNNIHKQIARTKKTSPEAQNHRIQLCADFVLTPLAGTAHRFDEKSRCSLEWE